MEFPKARKEESGEGEEPVITDLQISDDGHTFMYAVHNPDGTIVELAIPTRRLGVRFTANGVEDLEDE